ncbi:MAG: Ig-like domain-containing protein, partial [Patescibacteria group bacterium]
NIPGAFSWSVIENPALVVPLGVPYTDPITATPAANKVLATVQAGSANGTAKIQASFSGKSGTGNLIVQRNYCDTDADCRGKQNDGNTYYCTGSSCNIPTHECRPWIRELQSGTQIGSNVSGPKGNLVIVRGCFFGAAKGSGNVTFTGADGIAHNGINICPANWTNDEIRIQAAPVGASPGAFDVSVIAGNTLQSSNIGTFNVVARCDTNLAGMTTSVPDGGVPILCGVTPPAGRVGNQITYNGGRFDTTTGNSEAFYTQAGGTSGALPLAGTSTSVPSANSATSHVPLDTGIPTPPPSAAQTTIGVKPVTDPSNYCIATPVDFAISCTQNSECSTGCCTGSPNGTCKATSTCYGLIASASPAAGTLTCRNSTFRVDFTELMQTSTLNSSTAYLYDTANPGVAIPARLDVLYVLPAPVGTNSIVLTPNSPLPNATYRIFVQGGKGGVTSATG